MKVLMLQAQDLEDRGIRTESVSELIFRGKLLLRGATFSISSRQAALEACRNHLRAGIFSILVDNGNALTLWSEHSTVASASSDPGLDRHSPTLVAPSSQPPGHRPTSGQQPNTGSRAANQLTYRGRPISGATTPPSVPRAGSSPPVSPPADPSAAPAPSAPQPELPSLPSDPNLTTQASSSLPPRPAVFAPSPPLPPSAPSPVPTPDPRPQMTYRGRPVSRPGSPPGPQVSSPDRSAEETDRSRDSLGDRMGRLFRPRSPSARKTGQTPSGPSPAPQPTSPPPPTPSGGRSSGVFYRGAKLTTSGANRISGAGPEDRFRSFFENASEGLYQAAAEGRFTNVNPSLCQIFGYGTPQEVLELADISRLYVDPNRYHHLLRQLQTQESVEGFESEVYRKDGQRIWISESVRAIRDRHGTVLRYEGVLKDITHKRGETAILGERYQLVEPLGSGGFGETFLAKDMHRPNHPVCVVKKLTARKSDPEFLTMASRLFQAEAETLERIGRHNQIPQLLAYFEQGQTFYLVQELIEGTSLVDEIRPGYTLSEGETVAVLQDLLQILAFVHSQDVIHRDIKPSNVIRRSSDQRLVLIDFGAVKQLSSELTGKLKGATVAIGTPGYMPLEQSAGRPRKSSDIYAVGIIGIQALTGIDPEKVEMDDEEEPIWRPYTQINEDLAAVIDTMVRCHFAARYQSALDALQALRSCGVPPVYPEIKVPQS